ncbi:preprotein translocase subunit SecD [Quadrisphaera granulorum]|uniref:Protein translocase subunit SecD n=1 Tax=Quadrisphaera granulorum TaxID=317664 RepID=A0A316A6I0_9ACTN|nr:protein translocase subunit SecD [Quadrisphaera granulorum]PWJ53536.1 preprotein translocase subunit SecD [Quadrisphaera granulorum]SZE96878.1 preprotein translocase subunit SecD [Quadrisphaera granulorum]
MARSRSSTSRARRSLLWLTALVVALVAGLGSAVQWGGAGWTPKLALDLAGGTQIILTPQLRGGESADEITPQTIADAITIIRQRVDSSGLTEAEITSSGGNNIVVSLPGDPAEQAGAVELVSQSAQMRFRPVLYAEPVGAPAPAPTDGATPGATPGATDGATPGATDGATLGATPRATDSASPATTGSAPAASQSVTGGAAPSESQQGSRLPGALLSGASPTASGTATPTPTDAASPAASDAATPAPSDAASPGAAQAPDPSNPSDLNQITPELYAQFQALDCSNPVAVGQQLNDVADGPVVTCATNGTEKYILGPVEVEGTDISGATAGLQTSSTGAVSNNWVVNLSFDSRGAEEFGKTTTRLFQLQSPQNRFAIVLDGTVVSAPSVNGPITDGNAEISGSFTQETSTTLANQLKFGALPISFTTQSVDRISAVLGSEQLERGLLAGAIGLVLVVLYSLAQYRALGLVTVASLVLAAGISYLVTVLLGWYQGYRLSLAGVAGFIVSIGITADSFIVFFERVRDEVREGRSLTSAVETGWARARRTIIISDVVNFMAAAVLYFLAVGGVKGFAFILGLTTVIDLLVVMLFTHPILVLLARRRFFATGHRMSGFDGERLGRAPAYAGRGRVRTPAERTTRAGKARSKATDDATPHPGFDDGDGAEHREPVTTGSPGRTTIAQRRAAEAARQRSADGDDGSPGSSAGSGSASGTTTEER